MNDFYFSHEDKKIFIQLIELISISIYKYKKFNDDDYNEIKVNNDPELNCCKLIKKFLE
jgi:hypothetical protein